MDCHWSLKRGRLLQFLVLKIHGMAAATTKPGLDQCDQKVADFFPYQILPIKIDSVLFAQQL